MRFLFTYLVVISFSFNSFAGLKSAQRLSSVSIPVAHGSVAFHTPSASGSFKVPADVNSVTVELWGGGGAGANGSTGLTKYAGGGGGYATGVISVTPGETLTVITGGGGPRAFGSTGNAIGGGGAGNGGTALTGGGGGGRSEIQRSGTALMTAGGGGGGGITHTATSRVGGVGGGTTGGGPTGDTVSGGPGTSAAGGAAGTPTTGSASHAGTSGTGGDETAATGGAGGGGGYFGGGSGGDDNAGEAGAGGGGSSYIAGTGVTSASTTSGSGTTSGGASSSHFVAGVGAGSAGAATSVTGGNGDVYISWGSPQFSSLKSLSFGGTNQWANRTNAAAQVFTTTGSWSFWVKGAGIGNFGPVFQSGENSAISTRGPVFTDSGDTSGKIAVQWFDATNQDRWNSSVTVFDGNWHHVVFTFNSGTTKIYVDQIEDTAKVHTVTGGVTTLNNTTYGIHFGAQVTTATPATFFNGKVNNFSMWNVVLNQAEINALATSGHPADLSTHTQFSNCKGWYKFGEGDTIGANGILDYSGNALHLTPNNMASSDIITDAPSLAAWTPIVWNNINLAGGATASTSGNGEIKKTAGTAAWELVAYTNTQFTTFPVMIRFKVAEPSNNTVFDMGFADNASNNLSSPSNGFNEMVASGNFIVTADIEYWESGAHSTASGTFDSSYIYVKIAANGAVTMTHNGSTIRTYTTSASGKKVIPFVALHGIPSQPEILESAYCTLGASCP